MLVKGCGDESERPDGSSEERDKKPAGVRSSIYLSDSHLSHANTNTLCSLIGPLGCTVHVAKQLANDNYFSLKLKRNPIATWLRFE